jgi:hypothetical protein
MGAFFGFVFGLWMVGAVVSSPYFWAKRTDRSQAPIARRFTALGYGLGWPYFLFQFFAGKQQAVSAKAGMSAAEQRILGGAPINVPPATQSPAAQSQPQPPIQNPFDNL